MITIAVCRRRLARECLRAPCRTSPAGRGWWRWPNPTTRAAGRRHPDAAHVRRLARAGRRAPVADAVIIATQDADHVEPARRASPSWATTSCWRSRWPPPRTTAGGSSTPPSGPASIFAVCHVLRYTAVHPALKAILDSGRIGEIVSIQHLEPVGWWHQAHSFVRGNWRRDRRVHVHAAGQVVPRPRLAAPPRGRRPRAGVVVRRPEALPPGEPADGRRRPLPRLRGRGQPAPTPPSALYLAAWRPGTARPGR